MSTAQATAAPAATPAPTATPGAVVTPSAAAAPVAVTSATPATNDVNPGAWMAGFHDDLKGYMGNKGFKDPAALADAYRNLEKLRGVPQERLLELPERFYDDKGSLTKEGKSIYERLGAPKDAKEYDFKMPEAGGDPKLMEHFRSVFLESGIPKAAAEKIVGSWNAYQAAQGAAAKEAVAQAMKDQETALAKDWGMAHEQNTNLAKEAVRTMGISAPQIEAIANALGHAETMKLFHKFGTQVREAPFVGGTNPNRLLEPTNAKSEIGRLKADPVFAKRFNSGDSEAVKLMQSLHQQAYPGERSL